MQPSSLRTEFRHLRLAHDHLCIMSRPINSLPIELGYLVLQFVQLERARDLSTSTGSSHGGITSRGGNRLVQALTSVTNVHSCLYFHVYDYTQPHDLLSVTNHNLSVLDKHHIAFFRLFSISPTTQCLKSEVGKKGISCTLSRSWERTMTALSYSLFNFTRHLAVFLAASMSEWQAWLTSRSPGL